MNQQYRNIVYCSDVTGTGFWRHIQQILSTGCYSSNLGISNTYTQHPILDPDYYQGITSVTIQRWISDQQAQIVHQLLRPQTEINRAWLIYAIDDAMHYDDIPIFNRGRKAFASDRTQNNIRFMLNVSDFVVVTTDHIKQYYHNKYGVPYENILAVPNLLPKWWFGDRYEPAKKIEQFKKFKAKPRIGIISSLSHYNVDRLRVTKDGTPCFLKKDEKTNEEKWVTFDSNETEVNFDETEIIKDDFDVISDTIRRTVNDFQWVLFGHVHESIKDLVEKRKVEYHNGTTILQYPSKLENLQLQAVVAPIIDMEFNRCKSHIKYIECCALGIPLFASNCKPYSGIMKPQFLFDDGKDLEEKLKKLKFSSTGAYQSIIEDNWKTFNSPRKDGDFQIKNWWLDDNLDIWINLFKLKPKAPTCSLKLYINRKKEAEKRQKQIDEQEKMNTILKTDDGVQIMK